MSRDNLTVEKNYVCSRRRQRPLPLNSVSTVSLLLMPLSFQSLQQTIVVPTRHPFRQSSRNLYTAAFIPDYLATENLKGRWQRKDFNKRYVYKYWGEMEIEDFLKESDSERSLECSYPSSPANKESNPSFSVEHHNPSSGRPSSPNPTTAVVESKKLTAEKLKGRSRRKDFDERYIFWGELDIESYLTESNNYETSRTKESSYSNSSSVEQSKPSFSFVMGTRKSYNDATTELEKPPRTKSKRVTSTMTKASNSAKKVTRSRSSTMPGFSIPSERQRPFRAITRLRDDGSRFYESDEVRTTRRKINGENMYKNSASVPDSMIQFADLIHKEDRISHTEEKELGSKTQEAIRLQNLYDVLMTKLNREPTDDEWCAAAGKINMEAIRQTIDEGIEAKNKLVTSNLRMVQSVVNTYIRNGLSAQYNAGDMMQEGILALIRAAEKFEPDRGWKFSTYAMYWVRASVKRSQINQSRVITVPQRLYENHKRLKRIEKEIILCTGRKPTHKELGEAVGMSELQVTRCLTAMKQRCYSLDQQISNSRKPMSAETNGDTLMDIIESKSVAIEDEDARRAQIREDIIQSLRRHLSEEEVEVITIRFGLKDTGSFPKKNFHGTPPLVTVAELSRMVGLKPDKVRRIINNTLKHLKTVGLDEYLAFERELQ